MASFKEEDLEELKERCQLIFKADPSQYHNDASLQRFLRAFSTVDDSFAAVLKYNKWRKNYQVDTLTNDHPEVKKELGTGKADVLTHRDREGRPIVLMTVSLHDAYNRDTEVMTKFTIYLLETACKKCNEDVIDNICVIFDLKNFSMNNMDYQFVRNLIWLLSKYYPERLGNCLLVNGSTMFWGCWLIIRPWLHEITASKVTFINDEEHLKKFLSPEVLPYKLYG